MSARARSLMALVSPLSRARPLLRTARLFSATALLALTSPSANIGGVHRGAGGGLDPDVHNIKYDGRFTFARIRYVTGPGGYYYRGLPAWAHGYNMAESNLMKIMREVTALRPHVDESNAIALDDPELLKYPIAYMTEAGFWTMTDREAAGRRGYLVEGGFIIFDDFREDFGSAGGADLQMEPGPACPRRRLVELGPARSGFRSSFC